ncbi:MAG: hypothetical protein Q9227_006131 [Pyrenula ochraceoflavens]
MAANEGEEAAISTSPRVVASTFSQYDCTVGRSLRTLKTEQDRGLANFDSLPTTHLSESNYFKALRCPPDILEADRQPEFLKPYSTLPSPEPLYTAVPYPSFDLQAPQRCLLLSSIRDHPIRLNSALGPSLIASYPLINATTEAYISAHSLAFSRSGSTFITGSDSLICVFDVSRPGSGPVTWLPTIPSKRKKQLGGGVGMKGIISAMALDPNNEILAAGTFTRQIGLYGSGGEGDCIGTFGVQGTQADEAIGGSGVTQLLWSPCGTYLYVVERKSKGVMMYDIRNTGQILGWLEGRNAMTNQRLGVDLFPDSVSGGHEAWAGGQNGSVSIWKDPYKREGGRTVDWAWKAHEEWEMLWQQVLVNGTLRKRGMEWSEVAITR